MSRFDVTAKLIHHDRLCSFLNGGSVVPIGVEISPSAECNGSCPGCLYVEKKYSRSGFIDTTKLVKTLGEMSEAGVKSVTWSGGGEPTMHPEFKRLTESCDTMGQGLFTNALKPTDFDPTRMRWIRVTLNFDSFTVPVKNIKVLRACKTLGLCVNVNGDYSETIEKALIVADRTGADYVQVRPRLVVNGERLSRPVIEPINDPRVVISDHKFQDCCLPRGYDKCYGYHFVPFIWENGQFDVCGYMREYCGYTIGNIYEESFEDIIGKFPEFVKVHQNCQICCKNHEINKLINEIKDVEDKNFV